MAGHMGNLAEGKPPGHPSDDGVPVLLVEDDPDIRGSLGELLEEHGYAVSTAENGRQALEMLRDGLRPELIVLDLMLPEMSGWEFRAAQRADQTLESIPVVAISANLSPQAESIHANAYLAKPFDSEDLLAAIDRVLLEQKCRRLEARLRESERLAVLGTVSAGIGHEIRNPLTFMLGALDELQSLVAASGVAPNLAHRLIDQVREGAHRINSVLRALGRSSWKGGPGDPRDRGPVELAVVLESAVMMSGHEIGKRARLIRDVTEAPIVAGSESRLCQVFINLLVNAAQAFTDGSAETNQIVVRAMVRDGQAVVEISDTGEGVPPELRERIFEPFFTTKPSGIGTGLGLVISREVVEDHGGHIELESTPGAGSTFRVFLPLWSGPGSSPEAIPAWPLLDPDTNVVVVDDDELVLRVIRRTFENTCNVVAFNDPHKALTYLDSGAPADAVISDLHMPGMTGVELWARIKHRHPRLAERTVILTGGPLTLEAAGLIETGEITCIGKPFSAETLTAAVAEVLARNLPVVP